MVKSSPMLLVALLLGACGDAPTTPATPPPPPPVIDPYPGITAALNLSVTQLANYANPAWPVHYDLVARADDNTPVGNPVTDLGATLGRVLFHDTKLSINNSVSCATCHKLGLGLTDSARFSLGFGGVERTTAHGMRLGNARFYAPAQAFWDRRAASLEAQSTQPIQNAVEMGFDLAHGGMPALLTKMRGLAYYPELFSLAFGDNAITEDRMQRAIAQYVRSFVSISSRFDVGMAVSFNPQAQDRGANTPFANFTSVENRGKQLFLLPPNQGGAGCAGCHQLPTFALVANSRSNGLDAGETRNFKSPSLKNVAVTGPYMHDGRLATLEDVIEHYVSGIKDGPALDNRLKPNGAPQRLVLTLADKDALVAFLHTLTDNVLNTDPKFGDPFKR